jgi:hypothetical protein
MIYGTPILHIDDDTTDRVGIRTLIASKLWQPSRDNMSLEELDAERPAPPGAPAGTLLIGAQTLQDGGALRTKWTYEGHNPGTGITLRGRADTIDCGFEPGFSQVPLELHRKFAELLKNYGGFYNAYDGTVIWSATLGGGTKVSVGGLGGGTSKQETNPMFGQTSFFRIEGSYWVRYASLTEPDNSRAGTIIKHPPGNPPKNDELRDYLFLGPMYRKRGLVFDIVEHYWQSGPGGWVKPIYSNGETASTRAENYDQLTTGGL